MWRRVTHNFAVSLSILRSFLPVHIVLTGATCLTTYLFIYFTSPVKLTGRHNSFAPITVAPPQPIPPHKGQPQHRELHALLFSNRVWALKRPTLNL